MTKYKTLPAFHKNRVDRMIKEQIEPKHHINKYNNFEWDEPDYTLNQVHLGNYCARCLMIYYNCLCSHED